MRELSVQASNDTTTQQDRREIQKEMNQLIGEVDRIGDNTEFNTKTLLDGTFSGTLQIGANESQDMAISIASMKTDNIGTESIFQSSNGVTSVADLDFTSDNAKVTIGETTVNLTADYSDDMEGLASKLNGAFSQTEGVSVKADGSNLVYEGATDFGTPAYAAGTAGDGSAKLGTAAAASGTTGGALISSLEVTNADTATTGGVIDGAESAITALDNAINTVSAERSKLGAYQNRLDHTINNLNTSEENLTAAESRISDVDMAKEMMNMSKNQILSQAGTAMMAQANQLPQGVLQLLG
jgi:flagellin